MGYDLYYTIEKRVGYEWLGIHSSKSSNLNETAGGRNRSLESVLVSGDGLPCDASKLSKYVYNEMVDGNGTPANCCSAEKFVEAFIKSFPTDSKLWLRLMAHYYNEAIDRMEEEERKKIIFYKICGIVSPYWIEKLEEYRVVYWYQ